MRRSILAAAVLFAVVAAPAAAMPAAPSTCAERFTQADYRHYASRVLKRDTITERARGRMALMRRCQHSHKARVNVRRVYKRLARARWRRVHYWEWQRSRLSSGTLAMLARLRGCETRGIAFPANYRHKGHHRGAYQYTFGTWARAGGSGDPADASPAEQDVRTAWFYPSHRSEWACRA